MGIFVKFQTRRWKCAKKDQTGVCWKKWQNSFIMTRCMFQGYGLMSWPYKKHFDFTDWLDYNNWHTQRCPGSLILSNNWFHHEKKTEGMEIIFLGWPGCLTGKHLYDLQGVVFRVGGFSSNIFPCPNVFCASGQFCSNHSLQFETFSNPRSDITYQTIENDQKMFELNLKTPSDNEFLYLNMHFADLDLLTKLP